MTPTEGCTARAPSMQDGLMSALSTMREVYSELATIQTCLSGPEPVTSDKQTHVPETLKEESPSLLSVAARLQESAVTLHKMAVRIREDLR